jgi:membrane protein involved in colicin uptake
MAAAGAGQSAADGASGGSEEGRADDGASLGPGSGGATAQKAGEMPTEIRMRLRKLEKLEGKYSGMFLTFSGLSVGPIFSQPHLYWVPVVYVRL